MRCSGLRERENISDEPHGECEVYAFYLKITMFIKKMTTNNTSISFLCIFSF